MFSRDRLSVLVALTVALVSLLLLASGLGGLELLPAQPFTPPLAANSPDQQASPVQQPDPEGTFLPPALGGMLLLLTGISLIFFILSPDFRRQVLQRLRWLLGILVALLLLVYFLKDLVNLELSENAAGAGSGTSFSGNYPTAPDLWISVALTFMITLLILVAAWWYWQKSLQDNSLDRLGFSAQTALHDLQSGKGFRSAVLRCYAEMQVIVHEQRGLERKASMTPREFELALQAIGLPPNPVRELTRLFESVRYGYGEPGPQENERAVACLTEIVEAVGANSQSTGFSRRPV